MKPPRSSSPSQRPWSLRSPDAYPPQQPRGFRDQSLVMLLYLLLAVIVALGIALVKQ